MAAQGQLQLRPHQLKRQVAPGGLELMLASVSAPPAGTELAVAAAVFPEHQFHQAGFSVAPLQAGPG